jgi:hypothetical protein
MSGSPHRDFNSSVHLTSKCMQWIERRAIMGTPMDPPTNPASLNAAGIAKRPGPKLALIRYIKVRPVLLALSW